MILLSNITNLVSVKLDHTNYMLWKFQITSTLKAYKLLDVVDGSYPCPEMYIKDTNGAATSVVNPDFIQWDTKDQALISMISATLSPSALALVIGQKSAKGVWDTLEKRFTSFSRSNILSLKRDLHSIKKNSDSINVYMQKIKECKDKLEAVGVFVEDEELLHIVLDGLPTEMYPFCTAMRTRNEPIGLEELHVLINAEEKSLKNNSDSSKESMQHLAMLGTGPKSGTGTGNPNPNSPLIQFNAQSHRGGRGGRYNNFKGRGGRNFNNRGGFTPNPTAQQFSQYNSPSFQSSSRPTCQICYKMGHTAIDCYHRMDFAFQGKHPPPKLAAMAFSSNASTSNCWVSDTGATDHSTPDLANLQQPRDYYGNDGVTVGNGQNLPITHIGHTFGESPLQGPQ